MTLLQSVLRLMRGWKREIRGFPTVNQAKHFIRNVSRKSYEKLESNWTMNWEKLLENGMSWCWAEIAWNGLKKAVRKSTTSSGWNAAFDGSGIQYNDLTALNAVGADSGVSVLTLYANWKTNVTFDANGGTLAGGVTDAEKAVVGKASAEIPYSVNQTAATGLTANKANHVYVYWNTKPDGTGIRIENYGKITGPVTFYAVYYQSIYNYTGSYQVFKVPITGTYSIWMFHIRKTHCQKWCGGHQPAAAGISEMLISMYSTILWNSSVNLNFTLILPFS